VPLIGLERRLQELLGAIEVHLLVRLARAGERLVGGGERLRRLVGRRQQRGERHEAQARVGGKHFAHRGLDGLFRFEAIGALGLPDVDGHPRRNRRCALLCRRCRRQRDRERPHAEPHTPHSTERTLPQRGRIYKPVT
jgi:hypothetical protein